MTQYPLDVEFSRVRAALGVREHFPPDVVEAAAQAASRIPLGDAEFSSRLDCRHVPFVTIDPEGSKDLDQAFYADRSDTGFRVLYAIADLNVFVDRGSLIEEEAWRRGQTIYGPDFPTLLYPPSLSAGAASLLPDVERPCVLFTFDLDESGVETLRSVDRAVIRNHRQLAYDEVSEHLRAERQHPGSGQLAGHPWSPSLVLLEQIGKLRLKLAEQRGAVSLPISAQHVRRWAPAVEGYELSFRDPEDVEGWNAEISLMTGMASARLMLAHNIGLLRVLDPPRPEKLHALRLTAHALDIPWPEGMSYAEFIRSLDPTRPLHAAVIFHAASVMGGARYVALTPDNGERARHAAIAAHYSHVTAPLRRLADRYVLDLLVELSAGREPQDGITHVFEALSTVMESSDRVARSLEIEVLDRAEALFLKKRIGDIVSALVVRLRADSVTVQITDPPVRARIPLQRFAPNLTAHPTPHLVDDGSAIQHGNGKLALGQSIRVRLDAANPATGEIVFSPLEMPEVLQKHDEPPIQDGSI